MLQNESGFTKVALHEVEKEPPKVGMCVDSYKKCKEGCSSGPLLTGRDRKDP